MHPASAATLLYLPCPRSDSTGNIGFGSSVVATLRLSENAFASRGAAAMTTQKCDSFSLEAGAGRLDLAQLSFGLGASTRPSG